MTTLCLALSLSLCRFLIKSLSPPFLASPLIQATLRALEAERARQTAELERVCAHRARRQEAKQRARDEGASVLLPPLPHCRHQSS